MEEIPVGLVIASLFSAPELRAAVLWVKISREICWVPASLLLFSRCESGCLQGRGWRVRKLLRIWRAVKNRCTLSNLSFSPFQHLLPTLGFYCHLLLFCFVAVVDWPDIRRNNRLKIINTICYPFRYIFLLKEDRQRGGKNHNIKQYITKSGLSVVCKRGIFSQHDFPILHLPK